MRPPRIPAAPKTASEQLRILLIDHPAGNEEISMIGNQDDADHGRLSGRQKHRNLLPAPSTGSGNRAFNPSGRKFRTLKGLTRRPTASKLCCPPHRPGPPIDMVCYTCMVCSILRPMGQRSG